MSPIDELIGGYSRYHKQVEINSHKIKVINRYDRGLISYEKAIRLEVKVNEWLRVLTGR